MDGVVCLDKVQECLHYHSKLSKVDGVLYALRFWGFSSKLLREEFSTPLGWFGSRQQGSISWLDSSLLANDQSSEEVWFVLDYRKSHYL